MRRSRQRSKIVRSFEFASLESRVLMCADGAAHGPGLTFTPVDSGVLHSEPVDVDAGADSAAASAPLPVLHSNPSARAKLYLDFDGAGSTTWGGKHVPSTPAFDQDGNPSSFSTAEIAAIREIFDRVAEKYSIFNLDVTTEDPGVLTDKVVLKAVVGGGGAWAGPGIGGIAYVGGFYNSSSNVVWVFAKNLGNGSPRYTAEAIAHETGHGFGLDHHSTYSGSTKTNEYNPGNGQAAPILGYSYDAPRGLWWKGQSARSSTTIQDDLAVLSGKSNGFGYRVDDHAGSLSSPTALALHGSAVSGGGVITTVADADVFSFTHAGGPISIRADAAAKGAMLDLQLDLYDASGAKVVSVDTASLGESIEITLDGGAYRLVVSSAGGYGDVGQYSVSGTIVPPTEEPPVEPEPVTQAPPTPTEVVAVASSATKIKLSWAASDTATGYVVERSADGVDGWTAIATATAASYLDTTVTPGSTWHYRVVAVNAIGPSAASAVASVTTPLALPPAAPTGLVAKAVSRSSILLTWVDESDDEAGFVVEISLDGKSWKAIGAVRAGSTAARVYGLHRNKVYHFRVRAINDAGETSDASNASTDRTFAGFWRWGAALPAKRPVRVLPIRPRTMR